MFLQPNEHIIIMEEMLRPLRLEDFVLLDNCVQTVYLEGILDFRTPISEIDARISPILEQTDLKILLPFFSYISPIFDFWFENNILKYDDLNVAKSTDEQIMRFIDHFDNKRIQLTYAFMNAGEFPYPSIQQGDPYPYPDDVLINFIIERQKILCQQHNEIWTTFHNGMGGQEVLVDKINSSLCNAFPNADHYRVQFEYFLDWGEYIYDAIRKNLKDYGAKSYIGSGYIQGLEQHIDEAIRREAWGFITAPTHRGSGYWKIEDWMLDKIRTANERWNEAWNT